jgi:transcriptional regulator with XRE-family HTH domain
VTVTVDPDTVGGRLRAARKRAGLTQEQLAAAVGASQSTVCKWEQNLYGLEVTELIALADALGIHPAELLPGAAAAFIVIHGGPTGIGWSDVDRDRAEEYARNTGSVVCSLPIVADYRTKEGTP